VKSLISSIKNSSDIFSPLSSNLAYIIENGGIPSNSISNSEVSPAKMSSCDD